MSEDQFQKEVMDEQKQSEAESFNSTQVKSVWDTLAEINVSAHTEKKGKLTYLSWAWAWGIAKYHFPDISYKVINYDGKPWIFDHTLGYMVQTEVTIKGETIPMHLFVMDGANKAQRCEDYTYKVKDWDNKGQFKDKLCVAATMFDINTCIMRCLTKNLAMFGLGHYIYAGEDLPQPEKPMPLSNQQVKTIESLIVETNSDLHALKAFYKVNSLSEINSNLYLKIKSQLESKK